MALLCKLTDTSRFSPTGHARDSNSKRMLEVHTNRISQLLLLQSIHSDSSEKQCWGMFLHVSRKFKAVSRKVVSFQSVCVCLSVCLPACLPGCLAGWLAVCLSVLLLNNTSDAKSIGLRLGARDPFILTGSVSLFDKTFDDTHFRM